MKKFMRVSGMMIVVMLVLMSLAGCAKPPTSEMADAKKEFQFATDEGAKNFAPQQYTSAEEALNQANQLMEQRKYKQAREKALDAMRLAREARVAAVNNKNAANQGAKDTLDLATNAVNNAAKAYADTYAKEQMQDARATLQKATDAYNSGDFNTAKQLAEAAMSKAQEAETIAKDQQAKSDQNVAQQAAVGVQDPGATPRPYPTNHVVIKGESLWWIAEYKQIYGDPFQWPLIYKANRSIIKDPDLIFPDQNFAIPRAPEVTEDMIKEAIKFAKNRGAWSLHDGK
jgi:nucleoid-associated protein YgaU